MSDAMDAESFHRLEKLLADSGEAATLAEAHAIFSRYGVRIVLSENIEQEPAAQIIALTALNAAARSFRGNVVVDGPRRALLSIQGFAGTRIETFLNQLGLQGIPPEGSAAWPTIAVGSNVSTGDAGWCVRPWAAGWRFGLGADREVVAAAVPACVAAGGIAVNEAFSILRRDNPYAGRRRLSVSLWSPGSDDDADAPANIGPVASSWLIGLGHLGQAYAWTLGFIAPEPGSTWYLQDADVVTPSTLSTSLLSGPSNLGERKTRVVAGWLEARGYSTALVERRFDHHARVGAGEPRLAIVGVDNAAARRVLEGVGFARVIDAGLGAGHRDFRAIRVRTFPGPSAAATLWAVGNESDDAVAAPAYQALLRGGAEPCGVTTLATRAVGAPFVGCVAAALVFAQVARSQFGFCNHGYIDLNLRDPERVDTVAAEGSRVR